MDEAASLEEAIRELEERRPALGDEVVEAALAPLRKRLSELRLGGPAAGERKMATVLFADFAGYTRLVSSSDPEQVRELVTAAFETLVPAVERFGGTLEKFIGDAIMALFGVPRAHGDDARRACLAALAMREALGRFNKLRNTALELHFGIGSGLVVVGNLGLGGQRGYSAVGNAVNRAARIAALAEGGSVLVDEETRSLGGESLEFTELAPASLKGFSAPVALFRLEGEARGSCLDEAPPFVGRGSELAALLGAWRGIGKAGALALISGEAGIGKTRLAREAASRIRAGGLPAGLGSPEAEGRPRIVELRCSPQDRGSAHRLWLGLLGRLAGFAPGDRPGLRRDKLEVLLAERGLSPKAALALRALGPSLETEGEEEYREEEVGELPSPSELAAALLELLAAFALPRGLVLLLDGLEHLDPASARILARLAATALPPGLFLLLLSRDPAFPSSGLPAGGRFLELGLGPLSAAESRALAEALAGEGGTGVPQHKLERAGGNPLFLEELLRSGAGAEANRGAGGGAGAAAIPSALFGLIAARIDALPAAERESARIAAVLGERFSEELLAAAGGSSLALLLAEGILVREGEGGILGFRHPLFRETVYASLLAPVRRELHARAARAIKELYPEYAKERPELLAEHWRQAGEGRRALPYYKSAGTELHYRGAYDAALELLDLGLGIAREQAQEVYVAEFLQLRGRALSRKGEAEAALASFEEALGIQRGLGNLSRLLQLQRSRAFVLGRLGRTAEAETLLRESLELARSARARKELARLGLELSSLLLEGGEAEAALAAAREGLAAAEGARQLGLYRRLLGLVGDSQAALGRGAEAAVAYRGLAEACELSGEPEQAAAARAKAELAEAGRL